MGSGRGQGDDVFSYIFMIWVGLLSCFFAFFNQIKYYKGAIEMMAELTRGKGDYNP